MWKSWKNWAIGFAALIIIGAIFGEPEATVSEAPSSGTELIETRTKKLSQNTLNTLRLPYIESYANNTIIVDQAVVDNQNWVLVRMTNTPHRGLWLYENKQFWAINGKAMTAQEKVGFEIHPDANDFDIPAILEKVQPEL